MISDWSQSRELESDLLSSRHVKKHSKPDSNISILMNKTRLTVVGMTIKNTPSSDFLINRSSDSTIGDADCTMCNSKSGSGSCSAGGDVGLDERENVETNGVGILMLGKTRWRVNADIDVVFPSWARARNVGSSNETKSSVSQMFTVRSHAIRRPAASGVSPMRHTLESELAAETCAWAEYMA